MNQDCIFCKIVNGEAPADIVFENERLVVFKDINPHAPVHLLIVPRQHLRSINDLNEEDAAIIAELTLTARDMARKTGIAQSGYKLLFNVERGGGQVIFHLHMHLLGGWSG